VKDATGSFSGALSVIAVMLLGAMIFPLVTRRPGERVQWPVWRGVFAPHARAGR
jgi:hypothetical protein